MCGWEVKCVLQEDTLTPLPSDGEELDSLQILVEQMYR